MFSLLFEVTRAVIYATIAIVLVNIGSLGLWLFFGVLIYGLVATNFVLLMMLRVQALYSSDDEEEE